MRGADVARVARSHATAAVSCEFVRAAAAGCAGTPPTMICRNPEL
jgi:hypothetical protein